MASPAKKRNLVPLAQFLRERMRPRFSGTTMVPAIPPIEAEIGAESVDDREPYYAPGASKLLEGLRGPLFPIPGAKRVEPTTMSDVQGVHEQVEPHRTTIFSDAPARQPRPMELLTPREAEVLREIHRILSLPIQATPEAM